MFADIKGSMELMEDLDPEEARAIIDPALKLMIEAVRRYDGYIVQSTGDGIFALFGAPVAHEDHPQRALYAAVRLQEEMRRYSARLREAGNLPVEARVGVNTGEVVVRSLITGDGHVEYTPIGHSTSLAARMQALAPTGSIATTDSTRRLSVDYFTFHSLGPTRVRGISEPVNVYEVTGLGPLRTHFQVSARRGLTRFVGRQREIEALRQAFELASSGHGQIVAAMADPGMGKSRLFFEFKAVSQSGSMVLETFSVSHGKASAYQPVIELLHGYFGIESADDGRKRREKATGRVLALDRSLEDTLPYLFSLLALVEGDDPLMQMSAQVRKRRTLDAIKRILVRESLNQPLLVIFEDLHWIDEQTQDFLNLFADSIGTARVLLLVNYRPEYSHQWNNKTYYTQLHLDPLARDSAEEMLDSILLLPTSSSSSAALADLTALKRLIIERTEGTPFFMEEMVNGLVEEGALIRNGTVKLARPLPQIRLPVTVQSLLASRIDRLPSLEKELLHTLAVLGREFPLGLVQRVTGKSVDELEPMLARLQTGEFIYEQPAADDLNYTFKHALTQEVAYNSLLVERRKLLHERAGQSLETMFATQLEDHLSELAHHYSRSRNTSKAVEYLHLAGAQAVHRSANSEAIAHLATAIDLLLTRPETRERARQELDLQVLLGIPLIATKGWGNSEVERAYTRARELSEQLGDAQQLVVILYGLWQNATTAANLARADELANQIAMIAQQHSDPALLLVANMAMAMTCYYFGEFVRARDYSDHGFSLYDSQQHRSLVFVYGQDMGISCQMWAGCSLWLLGYPDEAMKRSQQALALAQEVAHPFSSVIALVLAAIVSQYRHDFPTTRDYGRKMAELSAEQGFSFFQAWGNMLQGWALSQLGQKSNGLKLMRDGLTAFRLTGGKIWQSFWLALLAEVCAAAGETDQAMESIAQGLTHAEQTGERFYEAELYRLKGELTLKQSSHADARLAVQPATEAETCFRHAIEIVRRQQAKSLELRATTSLARLLTNQDRGDEARAMLAEIYGWFTEDFDTPDLKDAKVLLEELGG
jgi:predicted ATPase/class 3 adenylate cyclase